MPVDRSGELRYPFPNSKTALVRLDFEASAPS